MLSSYPTLGLSADEKDEKYPDEQYEGCYHRDEKYENTVLLLHHTNATEGTCTAAPVVGMRQFVNSSAVLQKLTQDIASSHPLLAKLEQGLERLAQLFQKRMQELEAQQCMRQAAGAVT